jgi:hypothetical protein
MAMVTLRCKKEQVGIARAGCGERLMWSAWMFPLSKGEIRVAGWCVKWVVLEARLA